MGEKDSFHSDTIIVDYDHRDKPSDDKSVAGGDVVLKRFPVPDTANNAPYRESDKINDHISLFIQYCLF